MKPRADVDAELHTLRSYARSAEDHRERSSLESARFGLFTALEMRDEESARRWSKALRAALLAAVCDTPARRQLHELAAAALDTIDHAIEEE